MAKTTTGASEAAPSKGPTTTTTVNESKALWYEKHVQRAELDVLPKAFDLVTNVQFQLSDEKYFVRHFTAVKGSVPYACEMLITRNGDSAAIVVNKMLPLIQG